MDIVWQTPATPPKVKDYIFCDGRRHVRPYYFEFIAYVKHRWMGRTIVDLFTDEFKGRTYEYYVAAVNSGRIQVDGHKVDPSYVLKSSQKISHFLHRHEPPVIALDISILHKDSDVITVCKPASIPVHPCGQYRKNTILGILQAEHGLAPLFPIHRLDRLVSGLLIIARNADKADYFRKQIESGLLHKEYIARVVGVFPDGEHVIEANLDYDPREGRSAVAANGKSACTKFTRLSTDGVHSIVLCKPVSGRTHQIRVHLQYTGHSIANDILYLSENVVPRSSRCTGPDRAVVLGKSHTPTLGSSGDFHHSEVEDTHTYNEFSIDPMCTNCPNLIPKGYEAPEVGLWLHCVRYSGPGWTHSCPYPDWASLSSTPLTVGLTHVQRNQVFRNWPKPLFDWPKPKLTSIGQPLSF